VIENVRSVAGKIRGSFPAARVNLVGQLQPRRLVKLVRLVLGLGMRLRRGHCVKLAPVHHTLLVGLFGSDLPALCRRKTAPSCTSHRHGTRQVMFALTVRSATATAEPVQRRPSELARRE
jgi:hypothetical protein